MNAIAALAVVILAALVSLPAQAQGKPASAADTAAAPLTFNRLFKPVGKRNQPPMEDGIHDPSSPGTPELQTPLEVFNALPKANSGNRVDWGAALQAKKMQPRWEATKPDASPEPLDLNIVRQVKGSTPDVVFSHDKHGQYLDCANCHPAIFEPIKGANPMSMAQLALGEGCAVCHGRVAFPVSECRRCHSNPKATATAAKPGAK